PRLLSDRHVASGAGGQPPIDCVPSSSARAVRSPPRYRDRKPDRELDRRDGATHLVSERNNTRPIVGASVPEAPLADISGGGAHMSIEERHALTRREVIRVAGAGTIASLVAPATTIEAAAFQFAGEAASRDGVLLGQRIRGFQHFGMTVQNMDR